MIWKNKKMQNTLIYILHSTDHLSLIKRAIDQKLCLIKQTGLLYKTSSYSEPLLLYALFYKYVICILLQCIWMLLLHTKVK